MAFLSSGIIRQPYIEPASGHFCFIGPSLSVFAGSTMAKAQPPTIVEGATTGDVEDEIPQAAKSAEERKAAAALSSLDASREDDSASTKNVDQEAVKKAMDRLAGNTAAAGEVKKKEDAKKEVRKAVKVDQADVALLVSVFLLLEWRFESQIFLYQ
jgi:hypothetical protein